MKKRFLKAVNSDTSYGIMGEKVFFDDDLCVGDLISYRWKGNLLHAIVVKHNNYYAPMGLVSYSLKHREISEIRRVLPHNLVTEEIVRLFHHMNIEEAVQMTVSEIEKKLGYPIEIIEG